MSDSRRFTKRVLGLASSPSPYPGTSPGPEVEGIRAVFTASGERYGSPKITAVLQREGECISQKTVAWWMHDHRLWSRVTRKYQATTNSRHPVPVHENMLNQTSAADRPHAVWRPIGVRSIS
ncbi:IS3 family transposase [Sulfobacillus thermosulfidooxidans]|uniref:IS3 family transposase n=1 Tax=Sulfobacillus thermosulfidooxidans TaxID=28034 RepID=UPI0009DE0960|nr:IS3 family transposase [Sulfobacillus thermosulfidooxidans]